MSDTTASIRYPEAEARGYIESLLPTVWVAGSLARARFRSDLKLTGKAHGDVVTDVDLTGERTVFDGIAAIGPTHRIHSEGWPDSGKFRLGMDRRLPRLHPQLRLEHSVVRCHRDPVLRGRAGGRDPA